MPNPGRIPENPAVGFLIRSLLIGLVFAVARMAASALVDTPPGDPFASFALELAAGCAVGISLTLLGDRLAGGRAGRAIVLGWLVFVNLIAVMIEGAAFEPDAQQLSLLPKAALAQLAVSGIVGLGAAAIARRPARPSARLTAPRRASMSWLVGYLSCVLIYVFLYFAVGGLSFTLVTGSYYASGVAGLVVPSPAIVLAVAIVEGALFPIAVVPLSYSLLGAGRTRAIFAGTSLVVLGGIAPLIVAPSLPPFLRVASALEIAFQKFPAGAAAAVLLGPEDRR